MSQKIPSSLPFGLFFLWIIKPMIIWWSQNYGFPMLLIENISWVILTRPLMNYQSNYFRKMIFHWIISISPMKHSMQGIYFLLFGSALHHELLSVHYALGTTPSSDTPFLLLVCYPTFMHYSQFSSILSKCGACIMFLAPDC